jgi:hypothetical protein
MAGVIMYRLLNVGETLVCGRDEIYEKKITLPGWSPCPDYLYGYIVTKKDPPIRRKITREDISIEDQREVMELVAEKMQNTYYNSWEDDNIVIITKEIVDKILEVI